MDWSDVILLIAIAIILLQYVRLSRKNKRLRLLADEANRLRHHADATEQRNRQLKQEMTSNIAHELKTPVSVIQGYLETLLGNHSVDPARQRHYLERCHAQTLRLGELIQDVSIINKIEESSKLFPLAPVDVQQTAQAAFDEMADKAAAADVRLVNLLPPLSINGNYELLYRIFRNLTENSIAYGGQHIQVVVETYTPADPLLPSGNLYLHFYDTGCGVPDEALSSLFDRFVRIDSGRSRQNGGTGLGLSIVKHAVQFHGGDIYVANRPEGGLDFHFSLKVQS